MEHVIWTFSFMHLLFFRSPRGNKKPTEQNFNKLNYQKASDRVELGPKKRKNVFDGKEESEEFHETRKEEIGRGE